MTTEEKIQEHQRLLRRYGGIDGVRTALAALKLAETPVLGSALLERVPGLTWLLVQQLLSERRLMQHGPGPTTPARVFSRRNYA